MKNELVIFVVIVCVLFTGALTKVYERCELAKELRDFHEIPQKQLATWVCIAEHESHYNTSAINLGSGDHGIFQISQLFWCSPPGYACGVSCTDLRNDDIEDDVICARRIFREHRRLSGDGFNAWVVYNLYCKGNVDKYLDECFTPSNTIKSESLAEQNNEEKELPPVDYYVGYKKPSEYELTTVHITNKPTINYTPKLTTNKYDQSTTENSVVHQSNKYPLGTTTNLFTTTRKIEKPTFTTKAYQKISTTIKPFTTYSFFTTKITLKPITTSSATIKPFSSFNVKQTAGKDHYSYNDKIMPTTSKTTDPKVYLIDNSHQVSINKHGFEIYQKN